MRNDIDRIREALQFIDASDRDKWVSMGMAIKSELADTGFDLWEAWSLQAESFNPKDARDVWKSIRAGGKVTIGTLFYEAKANGWRDDGMHQKPTPEELAERRRIAAERAAQEEAEIVRERADTAKKAAAILKAATEAKADHPYLSRKRVSTVATLREIDAGKVAAILGYSPKSGGDLLTGRLLVVPVKQGDGLSTLELIDGDKRKAALAGRGSKTGGYWATERLPDSDGAGLTLLIGEGVATVLSAKEATGHPAIAALSSGNLPAVAKAMRERYPAAALVILADLVKATGEPDPHAIEAAKVGAGRTAIPDFGNDRDPDATDFNDMAVICGVEAVASAIASASEPARGEHQPGNENPPAGDSDDWQAPHSLAAKVVPVPYPIDALPDTIRAAVEEVAGFVKAPIPMVASSALAALSLAAQAHIDAKRAERLQGPVGLYLLTIADSGERKSTCDGFFVSAIRQYQEEQAEAMKPAIKEYQAAIAGWEAERDGILSAIKDAGKSGKSTDKLKADLAEQQRDKPEPPRVPRLLLGDETPENLAWSLAKQWPSAGVVSAEAGIVFGAHGMGKDSVMRNLGLLNVLWDGGSHSVGRRTSESFTVRGARLTVALQIQEMTLRSFFDRSGGLARGTGFLARFLVAWPESTQGYRPFTEAPANWPHLAAFHRRIAAILANPVPMDEEGALSPALLMLAPEAKAAWVDFHDAIEGELASGGELYDVRDVASKSADNAARLGALFQIFEHGMGGAVGLDCFESASRIAAWHLNEARRFFGELALPAELADAARLDSWLIEYCQRERTHLVPIAKLQQGGPGGLRSKAAIETALRELEDASRARLVRDGKRKMIAVNPALVIEGGHIVTHAGLIRKREPATLANANPAKAANDGRAAREPLARLATLALANPTEEKPAKPEKVGAGDTATASRWWLIHYPDRDPVEVACCPEATHADILERHPDAVAAEPFTPTIRQPSAPMTASEETAIRAWLALIEETDPATISEVVGQCQRDADARDYFTGRAAAELPKPDPFPDDRRTCDQCANLIARRCQAAKRGEIVASRNYEPIRDLPRRCEGYAPGAADTDRRPGRERWPGLIQKGVE